MERIPQSVTKRVPLVAYLSSDHVTAATGKTIAITISKNGAAFGNPSGGATNATEIASGWYYVDLSTTDTGTAGPLIVLGTVATVDPVQIAMAVVDAHNAGFDGVPSAAAGANGGLPLGDASGRVDLGKILGTAVSAPATAGILDVNVKNMNNVAGTSITTVNANQGTTQPVNYTGTGASALVKSDMVDIAGAAVSTSVAQIGVNVVSLTAGLLFVKKNTQLAAFEFIMYADATPFAPATGLTVTAERSLDGAAYGACANAVAEVGSGTYKITLATTDTNATTIMLKFTATGAQATFVEIVTQA